MVSRQKVRRIDTAGLSEAGLWVRRQQPILCLTDEALCLAEVQHLWNLHGLMSVESVSSTFCEVSSPDLPATWVYLLEVVGRKLQADGLLASHPLSQINQGEEVRLLALVQPPDRFVPGVLVETESRRRMLWLIPR